MITAWDLRAKKQERQEEICLKYKFESIIDRDLEIIDSKVQEIDILSDSRFKHKLMDDEILSSIHNIEDNDKDYIVQTYVDYFSSKLETAGFKVFLEAVVNRDSRVGYLLEIKW